MGTIKRALLLEHVFVYISLFGRGGARTEHPKLL